MCCFVRISLTLKKNMITTFQKVRDLSWPCLIRDLKGRTFLSPARRPPYACFKSPITSRQNSPKDVILFTSDTDNAIWSSQSCRHWVYLANLTKGFTSVCVVVFSCESSWCKTVSLSCNCFSHGGSWVNKKPNVCYEGFLSYASLLKTNTQCLFKKRSVPWIDRGFKKKKRTHIY